MENKPKGLLAIVLCLESVETIAEIEYLTNKARYAFGLLSSFLSKLKRTSQTVTHLQAALNMLLNGSELFQFVTVKLVFLTGCPGNL